MHTRNLILTVAVGTLAVVFILYTWMQNATSIDLGAITPTTTPESITTTSTSTVQLAMLDTEQTSNGVSRGCDKVVMVNEAIAPTTAPLTAALLTLFSIPTTTVDGWFNFIPRTAATLQFDHATVIDGTANIYLTGSLSGLSGVCDDPRAEIQIEETAKQFPTVSSVQLFLNNTAVDTLAPSMK